MPFFTPAYLKTLTQKVQGEVTRLIDGMAAKGACDMVEEFSSHLPLYTLCEILGVPEADFGRMLRLTQELFGASDPDTERFKAALSDEQFAQLLIGVVQDFTDSCSRNSCRD